MKRKDELQWQAREGNRSDSSQLSAAIVEVRDFENHYRQRMRQGYDFSVRSAAPRMYDFFWYAENIEYLARHDVTPEEFEEAFKSGEAVKNRNKDGHKAKIGYDSRGRLLFLIFDDVKGFDIIPVNAYEISEREKRTWN